MLRAVFLALSVAVAVAACNGVLGNTEASSTDDHLFDPSGGDASGAADGASDDSSFADGADGFDAAGDGGAGEAASPDGATFLCGTPAYVNDCVECPGKNMLCDGGCVASCFDSCGAAPIECVGCNAAGVRDIAVCEPPGSGNACLAGAHRRCLCPVSVTTCQGPTQVCKSGSCFACGEGSTDNLGCQGGGNCDDVSGPTRYTCH